MKSDNEILL